ncbi:hypothetical protein CLOLEP_03790 [[Clostridium] leptum DSM 753]|uniref:Uncharacterized protein n=1 Tax=[Clostridium] leptum DSM 753 TaxID=428125 RepID=A7VYW3_9FIRM|nr:hypothetical protein CLOLEP_03790 [[Clostridium] leptum DSM 753]PEQ25272.1 hypothetical protein CH238_04380 [[Clostridium] leptum DSM 753]
MPSDLLLDFFKFMKSRFWAKPMQNQPTTAGIALLFQKTNRLAFDKFRILCIFYSGKHMLSTAFP